MALFIAGTGQAQISFSVNLPAPPMWGPVGYTNVSYYYLPDVEAFYEKGYRGHGQKTIGERPGKGNPRGGNFNEGNRGNNAVSHGKGNNPGHGNDRGRNGNHNQGGGNGHGKK